MRLQIQNLATILARFLASARPYTVPVFRGVIFYTHVHGREHGCQKSHPCSRAMLVASVTQVLTRAVCLWAVFTGVQNDTRVRPMLVFVSTFSNVRRSLIRFCTFIGLRVNLGTPC